jgi:nitroreductase
MKNITASLDVIAETLQKKGLVKLAEELDEVSNALEVMASEDVEAGIAAPIALAAAMVLLGGIKIHGLSPTNYDHAFTLINTMPDEDKKAFIKSVSTVEPEVARAISKVELPPSLMGTGKAASESPTVEKTA